MAAEIYMTLFDVNVMQKGRSRGKGQVTVWTNKLKIHNSNFLMANCYERSLL